MSDATVREHVLVPTNRVSAARGVTGYRINTPLFDKDTGEITYYIAAFHPDQFNQGKRTALEAIPGIRFYGTHLTKNQCMGYTNTTDVDPNDPQLTLPDD